MPEHNIRHVDEVLSSSVAMLEVLEVLVLEGLLIDYVDVETIGTYINHIKTINLSLPRLLSNA